MTTTTDGGRYRDISVHRDRRQAGRKPKKHPDHHDHDDSSIQKGPDQE